MSVAELPSSIAHQHVHTVQFYGEDGVLLHELKGYIGSALAAGSSAIVIATDGHIVSLARTLQTHGIDVRKAQAENRYFALNATEVMSKFMVAERPDPVRFEEVVGSLIARAAQGARDENRCVVAFGEMVALLWAEGRAQAALELEKMWNALAKRHSFSLHCAYPMQGFRREELADSLLKICAEHTGVVESDSGIHLLSEDGDSRDGKPGMEASLLTRVEWRGRNEPFKLFVQNVDDYAIFMLDVEGRIASWNSGARRIKGYKAAEIVGQHFSRFYPEEDVRAGKPQTLLNRAIERGHVEDEGWRVRKDGSKFWANVTITAVKDDAGKLIGFGKVTRDLTERKRSELALHRSEERVTIVR